MPPGCLTPAAQADNFRQLFAVLSGRPFVSTPMRALITSALLASALAAAQTAPAPSAPAAAPTATAPAAAPAPAPDAPSGVSDPDKLLQSSEALSRIRQVLRESLAKLEEARNTRDVVKLNCVSEKLTQIKGLLRIAEQADVALQEAVARQETAAADHEFMKVTIARQKVDQLRTETEECIGQIAFKTDEKQQVDVQEPSYLPDYDPSNPPAPPLVITRPPPASPTL